MVWRCPRRWSHRLWSSNQMGSQCPRATQSSSMPSCRTQMAAGSPTLTLQHACRGIALWKWCLTGPCTSPQTEHTKLVLSWTKWDGIHCMWPTILYLLSMWRSPLGRIGHGMDSSRHSSSVACRPESLQAQVLFGRTKVLFQLLPLSLLLSSLSSSFSSSSLLLFSFFFSFALLPFFFLVM